MATFVKAPCDEGVIRSAPDTAPSPPRVGLWVLVATILGSSMALIDGSVVNVALPVIQRDFNATATNVQWVVESYSLFLAALLLVGGTLGDHFGRRRIFANGIVVFILASIACGFSPTVLFLILARAVEGIGGALMVPGSLAIISASFSQDQRGRAIGTWSGFTSIASLLGPVLGGWLVQYASWRWVFFINVPLAAIALIVLFWQVPESRDVDAPGRLDWWGAMLETLALGALVYGLIQAGSFGLGSPIVLSMLAVGMVQSDHVSAFALGRWAGESLWCEAAAGGWPGHHCAWLCALCCARYHRWPRQLLDHLFPGGGGDGPGHDHHRRSAHDSGHGCGRATPCWYRFRHQ